MNFRSPQRRWNAILGRPLGVLMLFVIASAFGIAGILSIEKDPSIDAMMPKDDPTVQIRDFATEVFGLEDPMVIALSIPEGQSVFQPEILAAFHAIQENIEAEPNVDARGVVSIFTESAIASDNGDLLVDPIITGDDITEASAALALSRVRSMPMFNGVLASKDGSMITLLVPLEDPDRAEDLYLRAIELGEELALEGVSVDVAGVAGMNGRLSLMVAGDTRVLIPAAALTALIFLTFALRSLRALVGPVVVIAGSLIITMGIMGWLGAHYYLISTALPVVILAIAIADSIHITNVYFSRRREQPAETVHQSLARALRKTALPVVLTSVTTAAGFAGLAMVSPMQPISEFGWFVSLGTLVAMALSLTVLPAIIVLTRLEPPQSKSAITQTLLETPIRIATSSSATRPKVTLLVFALVTIALGALASQAVFDFKRESYFQPSEPIRVADARMSDRLAGLNFLDVVVSAPEGQDLLRPERLAAIQSLSNAISRSRHVQKTVGIDDYMALMHAALEGGDGVELPDEPDAAAQYMLLYEASGDPGDFERVLDFDYRHALVRAQLDTDQYRLTAPVIQGARAELARFEEQTGLQAQLSGRVVINAGWMSALESSHFYALGAAIGLVFLACLFAFRSTALALITLVPVLSGILLTFAIMGLLNIAIMPVTSTTAAIATGLGVDFGIHLISAMRRSEAFEATQLIAQDEHYLTVARSCFFAAVSLFLALSVTTLSSAPPLQWFGSLVAAGAFGSLLGAIVFIPAVFAIFPSLRSSART
ncbi:MAG: MMPL family transporter [Pseudomonadota bacterium]